MKFNWLIVRYNYDYECMTFFASGHARRQPPPFHSTSRPTLQKIAERLTMAASNANTRDGWIHLPDRFNVWFARSITLMNLCAFCPLLSLSLWLTMRWTNLSLMMIILGLIALQHLAVVKERERDRQTDRQTETQADRQRHRQTDRQT